ncbi:MAG: toprim domain-containing protein [Halobacteriales archaeon]|nr:toprim domain-containing protein [Halobacteriales archaeon]
MRWDSSRERLRCLDEVLESVQRKADETPAPVLVEGRKDEVALSSLGIEAETVRISGNGRSLAETAERVSRRYEEAILLTDWDAEGNALKSKMKPLLESHGVVPRTAHRKRIRDLTAKEIHDVESLPRQRTRMRTETRR